MPDIHGIFISLNYLSVFVMLVCFIVIAHQKSSRMQKHALVVCFSLLVCCLGYLFRIQASSEEGLIIGQKLLYSFVTFGMYYMLLLILDYCDYYINRFVKYIFTFINFFITIVVLTLDYHTLFYKSYWAIMENGYLTLEKEYGIFHTIAVALFAIYMAAALIIAIIYSINNMKNRTRYVWRLLFAVSIPCLSYVVPKLLDTKNDLQPIAFALFTVMVLVMIYRDNLYDVNNISARLAIASVDEGIIVFNAKRSFKGCNTLAKKVFPELKNINLDEIITEKYPVLNDILTGVINDYKVEDEIYNISCSSVKNSDEMIIGKVFRIKNVTMERKYTELLQNQVTALSIISKKDELSGCYNRRHYEEVIDEIRKSKTTKNVHVWALDINELKEVNDTIDHTAGDEIIKAASGIMKSVFNEYGKVFRTGGDEFYAILQKDNIDNEKLCSKFDLLCSAWIGNKVNHLSVSHGYINCNEYPDKNIDEIVIMADRAMYKNKRSFYEQSGIDRRQSSFNV